jgi:hypothetical protein
MGVSSLRRRSGSAQPRRGTTSTGQGACWIRRVVIAQVLDGSAQEPRMGFDMQAGAEASVASAAGAAVA